MIPRQVTKSWQVGVNDHSSNFVRRSLSSQRLVALRPVLSIVEDPIQYPELAVSRNFVLPLAQAVTSSEMQRQAPRL